LGPAMQTPYFSVLGAELPDSDEADDDELEAPVELDELSDFDELDELEELEELDSSEDLPSDDLDSEAPNLLCPDGERWSVA
jgi:hypothetical protein